MPVEGRLYLAVACPGRKRPWSAGGTGGMHGQLDPEFGALTCDAPEADLPAHELRQTLADDEPDPVPWMGPVSCPALWKRLKRSCPACPRGSRCPVSLTRVAHTVVVLRGGRERHRPIGPVVLDRVRPEVHEDLDESRPVRRHHGNLRQRFDPDPDALTVCHRFERLLHLAEHLDHAHRPGRDPIAPGSLDAATGPRCR